MCLLLYEALLRVATRKTPYRDLIATALHLKGHDEMFLLETLLRFNLFRNTRLLYFKRKHYSGKKA